MPYGSKLHILPIHYHLLAAQQEPYKKALLKKCFKFSGKNLEEWTISRKWQDRKSKRTRQKIKMETGKGNQLTALRFQTGVRHQTSPASLWGKKADAQLYIYNQSHTIMIHKSWHEQWNKVRKHFLKWLSECWLPFYRNTGEVTLPYPPPPPPPPPLPSKKKQEKKHTKKKIKCNKMYTLQRGNKQFPIKWKQKHKKIV